VEALFHHISSTSNSDPTPLHVFYKKWFNLVNLADKCWYSVEVTHYHQKCGGFLGLHH